MPFKGRMAINEQESLAKENDATILPEQSEKPLEVEQGQSKLKPDLLFLHLYAFSMGIGAFLFGWVLAGYSPAAQIFQTKFSWDDDQAKFWSSVINTSATVGAAIGCLTGGKAISIGRRRAGLIW